MALDWEAIKTEYITTDTSQSKLAKKYGVPRSTICKWCAKEGWVAAREQYRAGVVQKTIGLRAQEDAKKLDKLIGAANQITDIAVEALTKKETLYTVVMERREKYELPVDGTTGELWSAETGDGVPVLEKQWSEDRRTDALNTRALKDLASIVKDMTGLLREFYDLPTVAQREQREINLARLEIERKKAEQGTPEGGITIIVPTDAEGLDE